MKELLAIVIPHRHFDQLLGRLQKKCNGLTIICVYDGKKPKLEGFLYVRGEGSFSKSSNIGIAYAQSLGFSYICLINDDVLIDIKDIKTLFDSMDEQSGLVSPNIFEKNKEFQGIFTHNYTGYTYKLQSEKYKNIKANKNKAIHHLGTCMLFRSSFRFDERYTHGMEDIEFSKRIGIIQNTKFVSNVSVLHKGSSTISEYCYDSEKKSLQGKFLLFEHMKYRLLLWSLLHVITKGDHKIERFKGIKDAFLWRRKQNLRR